MCWLLRNNFFCFIVFSLFQKGLNDLIQLPHTSLKLFKSIAQCACINDILLLLITTSPFSIIFFNLSPRRISFQTLAFLVSNFCHFKFVFCSCSLVGKSFGLRKNPFFVSTSSLEDIPSFQKWLKF